MRLDEAESKLTARSCNSVFTYGYGSPPLCTNYLRPMLVRPHPTGWRITLHPAHGMLAASLFQQLERTLPQELLLPSLLAVAEHDDHQLDFAEGNYLTERGAPKDFALMEMKDGQRSLQAENLLREAYRKHTWTYLLIGKHYEFLYAGQEVDERLHGLLQAILTKRDELLKSRGWKLKSLEVAYGYLRFCDRLSLILCGDEVPTLGRKVEINDALGRPHYVCQDPQTGILTVNPWPFAEERFVVRSESFVLEELVYASSEALGQALATAVAKERSWSFAQG